MAVLDNIIKVSSVNMRGLQTENKQKDVLDYFKNTDDNIICLQDCHWHNDNYCEIYSFWNNPLYINGISTNSRGVAILLKNNSDHNVTNVIKDDIGNCFTMDLEIEKD